MMKQLEQAKTSCLPHDLYVGLLVNIYVETAGASRNNLPTTRPTCWTVLILKQPEQGETSYIRHQLYAGLY